MPDFSPAAPTPAFRRLTKPMVAAEMLVSMNRYRGAAYRRPRTLKERMFASRSKSAALVARRATVLATPARKSDRSAAPTITLAMLPWVRT